MTKEKAAIETKDKTVAISVGHSKDVRGASGVIDEVNEAQKVTDRVATILKENGITAITFFDTTSKTQSQNLETIVKFHNSKTRALDVSVHFNATPGGTGSEVYYKQGDAVAHSIATAVSKAMATSIGIKDRGAKSKALRFINGAKAHPILLEVCFVDSKKDAEKYKANFEALCQSIAYTIARSIGAEKSKSTDKWAGGEKIPSAIKDIDPSKISTPTDSGGGSIDASSADSDPTASLSNNLKRSMAYTGDPSGDEGGFSVTTAPCDAGTRVIIDKNPMSKTYAEPIYPDLIDPQVEPDEYVETLESIKKAVVKDATIGQQSYSLSDIVSMGIDIGKLFFDYDDYTERTAVYDTNDQRYRAKTHNFGSPVNHQDPFPVDEKIEELQSHLPNMKIHRLWFCEPHNHTVQLAKVIMDFSDKAEKRMTKVENNLATLYRQVFRIGARMQINCVYYGGQSEYDKYKTIRCLHYDRVNDGQVMTLDQCLSCTRYEPILGKVYEIENEVGQSLELLKDNNQMAYQNMQTAIQQTNIEHKPSPIKKHFIDIKTLKERKDEDKDFVETFGESFVMDWNLVPVEKQQPHVRYDDGSETKRIASSYKNIEQHTDPTGAGFEGIGIFYGPTTSTFYDSLGFGGGGSFTEKGGSGYTGNGYYSVMDALEDTKKQVLLNDEAFNRITDPDIRKHLDNGRNYANSNTDKGLKNMARIGYEKYIVEVAKKYGVDPLLIMALCIVESGGDSMPPNDNDNYVGLMQTSRDTLSSGYFSKNALERAKENIETGTRMYVGKLKDCWNTTNPVVGTSAYNAGQGTVNGKAKKTGGKSVADPGLDVKDVNAWTFDQILPNLKRNATLVFSANKAEEVANYYPRVHFVYKILLEKKADLVSGIANGVVGNSEALGIPMIFPYLPEDMKSKKFYFTSAYGNRNIGAGPEWHNGIDIQSKAGTTIISAAAGKVIHAGPYSSGGTTVIIQHAGGVKTLYMHLSAITPGIAVGKEIDAGVPIGKEGSTGRSTAHHLHFEIQAKGTSKSSVDPVSVFTFLKGQRSLSSPIKFNI